MPLHLNTNSVQPVPSMLHAALGLAKKELAVFPCRPRGKEPATRHGVKDATTDLDVVARWWRQAPDCNIAIATGPISGILVLDIDDVDAEAELRKLETEYTALPATVESITARGRHLFFKWPDDRTVRNSAGKLAKGLDIRGLNGYVLAPPSIHPSGKPYTWSVDSASGFTPAPGWLLDKICEPAGRTRSVTPPADWCALIHDGAGEGCRNDAIARLVGHLLRRHVEPLVTLELAFAFNEARCRPPLPQDEVVVIVDSIAAREMKRRHQ